MRASGPITLVLGCGVRAAGDDAAGLRVIEGLSNPPVTGAELHTCEDGWPADFFADIGPEALLIFIAAVHNNAAPGTICCLKVPSKSLQCRHLHRQGEPEFTLEHELQLARKTHEKAPRTFLVGIEGLSYQGDELSERVRAGVDDIIRNFPRYLKLANDLA